MRDSAYVRDTMECALLLLRTVVVDVRASSDPELYPYVLFGISRVEECLSYIYIRVTRSFSASCRSMITYLYLPFAPDTILLRPRLRETGSQRVSASGRGRYRD
jgi:hypothetical protein